MTATSAWIFLAGAIALEVMGTFFLKLSSGFGNWQYGTVAIVCFILCFWFLAPALKFLPVGVVYAIWAGVGIVAAAILSLLVFRETLSAAQLLFIGMILIGAVGLKLATPA